MDQVFLLNNVAHTIATLVFEGQSAMDLESSRADTALGNIPKSTNTGPVGLIGEVIS